MKRITIYDRQRGVTFGDEEILSLSLYPSDI